MLSSRGRAVPTDIMCVWIAVFVRPSVTVLPSKGKGEKHEGKAGTHAANHDKKKEGKTTFTLGSSTSGYRLTWCLLEGLVIESQCSAACLPQIEIYHGVVEEDVLFEADEI